MTANRDIILKHVEEVYSWIDSVNHKTGLTCQGCGKCCDFENYDHKLFVTTPELVYFAAKLAEGSVRKMTGRVCPYNSGGKCLVYNQRFGGCRIFFCKGNAEAQSQLSEEVVGRFKEICTKFGLDYHYVDLASGLNIRSYKS